MGGSLDGAATRRNWTRAGRFSVTKERSARLRAGVRSGSFGPVALDAGFEIATILAMPRRRVFEVVFDTLALDHMDAIERKSHTLIRRTIDEHLVQEPDVVTRNRKPLTRATTIGATWEVRCGPANRFRIFYDIHHDERLVVVLAIAREVGERLFVGKERFQP
jgi:hypothetical protein